MMGRDLQLRRAPTVLKAQGNGVNEQTKQNAKEEE
jgi:hypothetical protein